MLNYKDVSKLEGLGWTEYEVPIYISPYYFHPQLSIEVNSIDMVYFLLTYYPISFEITHIPNMDLMGYLLPDYCTILQNVPKIFKDKYFPRREMENLLDLKDILNNL
jgi:hypothetical protein